MRKWIYTGVIAVLFIIAPICDAVALNYSVIYRFTGGSDGGGPVALIADPNGSLYGLTLKTIFKLTPPAGGGGWVETTLYTFEPGLHDCLPNALAMDSNGALYGTASACVGRKPLYVDGIVFKLVPPTILQGAWSFALLHRFRGGSDGAYPNSIMVGANNVVYGVAEGGGHDADCNGGCGTIFALIPSLVNQGPYAFNVISRFTGGRQGAEPRGTLYQDSNGALYGTALAGGIMERNIYCSIGCGTVFKLTPPIGKELYWHQTTLYRFNAINGAGPASGVVADSSGALYGTTQEGGSCQAYTFGCGTAFKLVPPSPGRTLWTRDLVYKFGGLTQGYFPYGLTMGSTGLLYGTTYEGGNGNGYGTVFSVNAQTGVHKVLYSFEDGSDGAYPQSGLVAGPQGVLYGTTFSSGANICGEDGGNFYDGCGTVFELVP